MSYGYFSGCPFLGDIIMSSRKHTSKATQLTSGDEQPSWVPNFKEEIRQMMQKTLDESMHDIKVTIQSINTRTSRLESRHTEQAAIISHLRDEQSDLTERISKLECRSMQENLIFSGIPEEEDEDVSSLTESVMSLITDVLEVDEDDIHIITCHRLNYPNKTKTSRFNQSDDRPRNVVVRLSHKDEVFSILRSANKLKGHEPRIFINQQYPQDIGSRRRILQPVFYLAKQHKMKASLNQDKLYIDGKLFNVTNINDVPFDISCLNQKEDDATLAFHGRFSPFSNFYPAEFKIDGSTYSCSEQFYQHEKALAAKDIKCAVSIMMTNDPLKMKRYGDTIIPPKAKWQATKTMAVGLKAKFEQNPDLTTLLLGSEDKKLVEGSYDKYWGCGTPLHDRSFLETEWKGKNTMGKLLITLRTELQKKHS